ncbi:MAG: PASTA domain-containing protein [Acidobacteriota bacterium]
MNPESKSERASTGSIIWTISRRLAMVVVLTLAFILSAAVTIYVVFRGGNTRVPDVVGKSEIDAKRLIESAQLEFRVQHRNDDAAAMNTVIETRPAANSAVKKNSVVTVVISNGPAQTKSANRIDAEEFLVSGFWSTAARHHCLSKNFANSTLDNLKL